MATTFADSNLSPLWPSSVLSLVLSALILPFARLADLYGGYPFFIIGLIWLAAFSSAAGFAPNEAALNVFRAMQGAAIASFEPASFALIGRSYPPGRRRNLVFGIYGACAPAGFYAGILASGVALKYGQWQWYFHTAAILAILAAIAAYLTVPYNAWHRRDGRIGMDWLGSFFIAAGLILVAYSLAAASYAPGGWTSGTIIGPFLAGLTSLAIAMWVEMSYASFPLLPAEFFRPKGVVPVLLVGLLLFASFGIYLFYATF